MNLLIYLLLGISYLISFKESSMPIPDLYNTGVDDYNNILTDGSTDFHYRLISSSDKDFPGSESKVALSTGFPMDDRWVPNNSVSKWIAPRINTGEFNQPGAYVYRIQFDLTKFKSNTAVVKGLWSSDNNGLDILINNKSTGHFTPPEAYYGMFPFEINEGFSEGINTIDFIIYNINAPTGLRVELNGMAEPKEYVDNYF